MKQTVLKVHPQDNVLVALIDLKAGQVVHYEGQAYTLLDEVKAKHKFTAAAIPQGGDIIMYGVLVGKAQTDLALGNVITTANIKHAANDFVTGERHTDWVMPDVSKWKDTTFQGFHRSDGSVGTANYWLVVPMVFCENRNLEVLQEALVAPLGYGRKRAYQNTAKKLIDLYKAGSSVEAILEAEVYVENKVEKSARLFPHVCARAAKGRHRSRPAGPGHQTNLCRPGGS